MRTPCIGYLRVRYAQAVVGDATLRLKLQIKVVIVPLLNKLTDGKPVLDLTL